MGCATFRVSTSISRSSWRPTRSLASPPSALIVTRSRAIVQPERERRSAAIVPYHSGISQGAPARRPSPLLQGRGATRSPTGSARSTWPDVAPRRERRRRHPRTSPCARSAPHVHSRHSGGARASAPQGARARGFVRVSPSRARSARVHHRPSVVSDVARARRARVHVRSVSRVIRATEWANHYERR